MANPELRYAVKGSRGDVIYAVDDRGTFPCEEFLESLLNSKNGVRHHANLMHQLQVFADMWAISNSEKFKKVEGSDPTLVEFKKFQIRLLGFYWSDESGRRRLVLTHGFSKKKDKMPPAELDRAYRIRIAHMAAYGE